MIVVEGGSRAAAPKRAMTYDFTQGNFLLLLLLLLLLILILPLQPDYATLKINSRAKVQSDIGYITDVTK